MMLSNLNLSSLPECNFEVRYVDSVLLNPCAEYQRLLRMGKVAKLQQTFRSTSPMSRRSAIGMAATSSLMVRTPLRHGKRATVGVTPDSLQGILRLSKEHEALLFAVQTGISTN